MHARALHPHTEFATVATSQELIIRDVWGNGLSATFDQFCVPPPGLATGENQELDEYDFSDPFIDNTEDERFSRATVNNEFVRDMHDAVRFMSYGPSADETKRQREVRAYLNHLHLRVAHGETGN